MGILSWLILGLIAGWIGSKIVNRTGEGFFLDIVLGIVGALVGGFLFSLVGAEGVSGLNLYSMFVAVIGSITRSLAAAPPDASAAGGDVERGHLPVSTHMTGGPDAGRISMRISSVRRAPVQPLMLS
jgi:uncharacterized membrane protein YeaQ/YmgE (transglycosylase-associated protein family)